MKHEGSGGSRGRKRQYAAMLYRHTGLVPTSPGGRTFFEVLPSLALIWGQRREHFSWRHTDVPNHTVYFNLNNDQHEIVRPDHLVWCLTNTVMNLRVLLAVGCVALPRVVHATRGATAGRPYRSSRLADNQNALASS